LSTEKTLPSMVDASFVAEFVAENPTLYRSRGSRIHMFIDYSNLQLTMRSKVQQAGGQWRFFDWEKLPDWLMEQTKRVCKLERASYEGMHVYVSDDPDDPRHDGTRKWVGWLDQQVGIQVVMKEMRAKDPPLCRYCGTTFESCPQCGKRHRPRVEKGIDTAIVTDMIRLAWYDTYDIAVLASSDSDFVPVVELLGQRGLKVVQAGVRPQGSYLRRHCWASIDMFEGRSELRR